jgi:hypothetical protein
MDTRSTRSTPPGVTILRALAMMALASTRVGGCAPPPTSARTGTSTANDASTHGARTVRLLRRLARWRQQVRSMRPMIAHNHGFGASHQLPATNQSARRERANSAGHPHSHRRPTPVDMRFVAEPWAPAAHACAVGWEHEWGWRAAGPVRNQARPGVAIVRVDASRPGFSIALDRLTLQFETAIDHARPLRR